MRGALALAAGAALLIAALVALAPAGLLDSRLATLSGGHLRVVNTAGTVWNGSGELVQLPAGSRQPLHWRLDAWPLLHGEVRAAIGSGIDGALSATLVYGHEHFELRGLDFSLPVESLLRSATAAKVAQTVGGNLELHVDHLLQQGDTLDGQLTLQWDDASVPGPRTDTRIALGTLRADLSGRGPELAGPLRNSGGDVEIDGQIAIEAGGAATLEATVRPRSTTRERADLVAAALATLGTPDAQGGTRVNWAGSWR
jgi:hypothetical protein